MTSRRFYKSKTEAATERWYVTEIIKYGDVTRILDEDLSSNPLLRRVSEWEFVTVGPSDAIFVYVWRCRIVDDDDGPEREAKLRMQAFARDMHTRGLSFEDVATAMKAKGWSARKIDALRAAFLEVAQ
jgi:hypothetical protein